MEYQEFLYAVEKELNKRLKEGVRASVYTAIKNNGREKKGVMIEMEESNAAPTIYLEEFYIRYQQGASMEELIHEIITFYESVKSRKIWDCSQFEKYEDIRDKIVFKLIHRAKNRTLLRKAPSIEVLDLSIVFYVLLEMEGNGSASIEIHNEHMKNWGVQKEELFLAAVKNVRRLLPAEFFSMLHVIDSMLEQKEEQEMENLLQHTEKKKKDIMYVLTNTVRNYGAACMIYPHVLEMIGDILKEDFYILPSSVHEVIIVPESKGLDPQAMDEMVVEINETQVEPDEVLSDHAYFYQREGKRLMLRKRDCEMEVGGEL